MKYERGTTMGWIEIQRTDAEQPFHVVFKAGNGHETFWCENLVTRANALRVIKKHAALFAAESGLDGPVAIVADWRHASGRGLRMHPAAVTTIEIRERDLRASLDHAAAWLRKRREGYRWAMDAPLVDLAVIAWLQERAETMSARMTQT